MVCPTTHKFEFELFITSGSTSVHPLNNVATRTHSRVEEGKLEDTRKYIRFDSKHVESQAVQKEFLILKVAALRTFETSETYERHRVTSHFQPEDEGSRSLRTVGTQLIDCAIYCFSMATVKYEQRDCDDLSDDSQRLGGARSTETVAF